MTMQEIVAELRRIAPWYVSSRDRITDLADRIEAEAQSPSAGPLPYGYPFHPATPAEAAQAATFAIKRLPTAPVVHVVRTDASIVTQVDTR